MKQKYPWKAAIVVYLFLAHVLFLCILPVCIHWTNTWTALMWADLIIFLTTWGLLYTFQDKIDKWVERLRLKGKWLD